jgi:hypothetical protein
MERMGNTTKDGVWIAQISRVYNFNLYSGSDTKVGYILLS